MIQLPALLTFLLLVIPSIIDHVQLDEVVVLAFFLYQNSSKLKLHSNHEYSSFESISVEISYSSFSAYFVCIYRPPGHPANFFEEFQDLLENVAPIYSEF